MWRLGCQIWALDLEPIKEEGTIKALEESKLRDLVSMQMEVKGGSRRSQSQSNLIQSNKEDPDTLVATISAYIVKFSVFWFLLPLQWKTLVYFRILKTKIWFYSGK